jgi:hypothetical protein
MMRFLAALGTPDPHQAAPPSGPLGHLLRKRGRKGAISALACGGGAERSEAEGG